jgi:hypothetical protein
VGVVVELAVSDVDPKKNFMVVLISQ